MSTAEEKVVDLHAALAAGAEYLLAKARKTRKHAQAYAAVVHRFSEHMPGHMERFHHAMTDFRRTAHALATMAPREAAEDLMAAE